MQVLIQGFVHSVYLGNLHNSIDFWLCYVQINTISRSFWELHEEQIELES